MSSQGFTSEFKEEAVRPVVAALSDMRDSGKGNHARGIAQILKSSRRAGGRRRLHFAMRPVSSSSSAVVEGLQIIVSLLLCIVDVYRAELVPHEIDLRITETRSWGLITFLADRGWSLDHRVQRTFALFSEGSPTRCPFPCSNMG